MMVEYRIKVEEHKDGSIAYVPQVGHKRLHIGKRYAHPYIEWENLHLQSNDYVCSSFNQKQSWYTEDAARLIIDRYKKQLEDQESKRIINTRFINL